MNVQGEKFSFSGRVGGERAGMVAERLAIKAGNTRAQVWHATHATAQDARALTKRGEESNIVIGARPLVSPL